MNYWKKIPFVRLIIPLVSGIVLQEKFQFENFEGVLGVGLIFLLAFLLYLSQKRIRRKYKSLFGIASFLSLFLLGIWLHYQHQENHSKNHFSLYFHEENTITGIIKRVSQNEKKYKVELEVLSFKHDPLIRTQGRLLAYLKHKDINQKLIPGDHLMVTSKVYPIAKPLNPKAFDFARYMHVQNIHFQTFVTESNWQKLDVPTGFSLLRAAYSLQKRFLTILRRHLPREREFGVTSALILGDKSSLEQEVKTAYSDTGAIHVLAVSGLHTGFIYFLVSFLLRKLPFRGKGWMVMKTLIVVLSLWGFAFVTGLSPSVLRSATMFSFIAVGVAINRHANIYNTLAASAFCLLIVDPFLLFSPGFQLSYAAVAGIVYFQPYIYRLIYFKSKLFDYLWNLIGVSISAQLSTFPLSLYYFHKIPLYFWLSGLIVVPAAAVILPLGLLLFAVDGIPWIGWGIGKILNGLVWFMNELIFQIQAFPGTLLEGIWIGSVMFLLITGILITLINFIEKRRSVWIFTLLSLILIILAIDLYGNWKSYHQKEIIVYYKKGASAIDIIDGLQCYTFSSRTEQLDYVVGNYQSYKRIKHKIDFPLNGTEVSNSTLMVNNGLFSFGGTNFLVVNETTVLPEEKQYVNFIILAGNPKFELADLNSIIEFEKLIIDGATSWKTAELWKQEAIQFGLDYVELKKSGAQIFKIK